MLTSDTNSPAAPAFYAFASSDLHWTLEGFLLMAENHGWRGEPDLDGNDLAQTVMLFSPDDDSPSEVSFVAAAGEAGTVIVTRFFSVRRFGAAWREEHPVGVWPSLRDAALALLPLTAAEIATADKLATLT